MAASETANKAVIAAERANSFMCKVEKAVYETKKKKSGKEKRGDGDSFMINASCVFMCYALQPTEIKDSHCVWPLCSRFRIKAITPLALHVFTAIKVLE